MMSQAGTNGFSVYVLWARRPPSSPLSLSFSLWYSIPPCPPSPPVLLILSNTLQWSLAQSFVTSGLMSHSAKQWDDHMIGLNCMNLANTIRQPNLDMDAVCCFLSVSIRRWYFSLLPRLFPLCSFHLCIFYPPLSRASLLFSPYLPPGYLISHPHRQEVILSPLLLKNGKLRQIVPNTVLITPNVRFKAERGGEKSKRKWH